MILISACLLFTVLPQSAVAQSYGIKGGAVLTNIQGQRNRHVRPGAQIGAFANFGGEEVLYVKTELLITQKGSLAWNTGAPENVGLYYAEINVMFGIDLVQGLTLNLGFQPAILMYGHADFSGIEGGTNEGGVTGQLTTLDYSTLMGLEYFLDKNRFIGLRYNHGFVPLQGREGELPFGGRNPTNMTIQVYFGIRLK